MGRFRFLTAGESHGPTLGVVLEGVPAGLALTADDLAIDLARRQRGYGRGARQSIEHDRAEVASGVRHGVTLGSPIMLLVANRDWENWTRVIARVDEARANGDTVGGVFEVVVHGAPIGLGSYVQWDRRLDAALAAAVVSINIVKGVE